MKDSTPKVLTFVPPPAEPTLSDADACFRLFKAHRDLAPQLPLGSEVRALILRCGERWLRIGQARSDNPVAAPKGMEVVG